MKPLVTRNIEELRPYAPGKPIEETQRETGIENPTKMASNENPLGPSPLAIQAIEQAASTMNFYPDGGCYYLKQKLAEHLSTYDIEPHNLIIGNGSNEIIEFIIRTFVAPDENIVMGEPSFIIYRLAGISHNREEIAVPLKDDLNYNLDAMAKAANDKTKVIFLASPNNPTGLAIKTSDFEHFLTRVRDDVILCIDEAYAEYVIDPEIMNGLQYAPYRHRLVVLRTFSKVYGLAGLRIGYGISSKEVISYMDRVRPPFNVNRMAQIAAIAALDDQDYVKKSCEMNNQGRQLLEEAFSQLGLQWYPSQANFLLVDFGKSAKPFFDKLLKKGYITRLVENYGLPNCLRITIGTKKQNAGLISALESIL